MEVCINQSSQAIKSNSDYQYEDSQFKAVLDTAIRILTVDIGGYQNGDVLSKDEKQKYLEMWERIVVVTAFTPDGGCGELALQHVLSCLGYRFSGL